MPIRMHALHEAAKNGHLEVIQVYIALPIAGLTALSLHLCS